MTVPCLLAAWSAHEAELRRYLRHRLADPDQANDLLHDVFLKACQQGEAFCAVGQPRAWLFEVARNTFLDHCRRQRPTLPLPPDLAATEPAEAPVDQLAQCLPRVLAELSPEDREALSLCDLGDMTQAAFDTTAPKIREAKGKYSVGDCQSSSGNKKSFYQCMSSSNNHVTGCDRQFKH